MLRGLNTAASGMLADERLQQLLANDLANAQTVGFKASNGQMLTFPTELLQRLSYGSDAGVPIGTAGSGVVLQEGVPFFTEGTLQSSGRNLDVAIVDGTPVGSYAAVASGNTIQSAYGNVTAGANGRLGVNGQSLAVMDSSGHLLTGLFAMKNPQYTGNALVAEGGKPNYDSNGQPSYVFANAQNKVVGAPGQSGWDGAAVQVGTQADMGDHSFFAVAYQSPQVSAGLALTRNGSLQVNAQHELTDSSGHPVLPVGADGKPIPDARIVTNPSYRGNDLFDPSGRPVTDAHGQLSYTVVNTATGARIPQAHLGTVNADISQLTPLGQTEFMVGGTLTPTQVLPALRTGTGILKPGQVEQSNVDVNVTVTKMLTVMAQYQANQEMIRTEDSVAGLAVQDVGKVNI